MGTNRQGVLVAENISKHFGGTQALSGVSFTLKAGEVHALMGENGAGKSTLGKILAGIHQPDGGEIYLDGQQIHVENPRAAKEKGISIVLQEFNLLPDLSVAENLIVGNDEYYKFGKRVLDKRKMYSHSKELLSLFKLGANLDVYEKVKDLTIAQMQILEILKAVDADSRIIILDEPTAALSGNEVDQLFEIVRRLQREKNIGFIIVSHKIEEIFAIADRVTVFRDGKQILDGVDLSTLTENDLVKSMVGREITNLYGSREFGTCKDNEEVLRAEHITDVHGRVKDVSLSLRKGEIVGLTGVVGAGRTELARCIFGIDHKKSGKVFIHGKEIPNVTIRHSIEAKIGFVPEDRKYDGLILNESIADNISQVLQNMQKSIVISKKKSVGEAERMKKELNIKMGSSYDSVNSLSGGNQQKVLLGKWMLTDPEILIIDEPTRGIDIASKSEIYTILNDLSRAGVTILMISSEQPEIIGMCDRILVMREGVLAGELSHEEVSEQRITALATIESGEKKNEE
ncbi:MAG: sugar ABC transporter ATP-binding protein [Blautia sp.]|nr:sugar ABC transporter ATP-binding protein [Blautia sp.]